MPCTCSAIPELISGGTTVPIIRPAPRMLEASRFGTKPAFSIAASTLARVAGATSSGLLSTRDTVIGASADLPRDLAHPEPADRLAPPRPRPNPPPCVAPDARSSGVCHFRRRNGSGIIGTRHARRG